MVTEQKQRSFPGLKYPSVRDEGLKTAFQWLKGKSMDDGAEGLWRIHDKLYDLTDFVKNHPGGSDWLIFTKNTDITELFETHHLSDTPFELAKNYYKREAKTPRNYPFTFNEDGFYKTLKIKIKEKLKELPKQQRAESDLIINYLIAGLLLTTVLLCWLVKINGLWGATFALVPGFLLSCITTAAHNYFHQKDNWQMYLFNLSGMSFREWRISHAMSHHMHTNTAYDAELSTLEPILQFLPDPDKTVFQQFGAFYFVVVYPFVFASFFFKKVIAFLFNLEKRSDLLHPADAIFFVMPVWMHLFGGTPLITTLGLWLLVLFIGSFLFTYFGLTAGHHNQTNFFEGDFPRGQKLDWGEHQLDTIVERMDLMPKSSYFAALTSFGDHALHHMFPTLDHAYLKDLYPVFLDHCEKYEKVFRMTNQVHATFSKCRQLMRKKYNDFRVTLIK